MQQTNADTCTACHGRFDPLSRQATQNHMGPWQVRDESNPFTPGFDDAALRKLCKRGRIHLNTVVRGPTTRQFWTLASNTPVVAALLGQCHSCHAPVGEGHAACASCGADLFPPTPRDALGLAPVQPLPGQADPREVAEAALGASRAFVPAPPASTASGATAQAAAGRATERRLRREVTRLRQRVTALAIACVFLAVAGLGVTFQDRLRTLVAPPTTAPTSAGNPQAPTQSTPDPTAAPPRAPANPEPGAMTQAAAATPDPEVILDPELAPWLDRYRTALETEAMGDLASLETALEAFEAILFEAEAELGAGMSAPPDLPILRDKIARLSARVTRERALDAIRLAD